MTGVQCIGAEFLEKEMHLKCCIEYRKIENTLIMLSILNEIVWVLKGINFKQSGKKIDYSEELPFSEF